MLIAFSMPDSFFLVQKQGIRSKNSKKETFSFLESLSRLEEKGFDKKTCHSISRDLFGIKTSY